MSDAPPICIGIGLAKGSFGNGHFHLFRHVEELLGHSKDISMGKGQGSIDEVSESDSREYIVKLSGQLVQLFFGRAVGSQGTQIDNGKGRKGGSHDARRDGDRDNKIF